MGNRVWAFVVGAIAALALASPMFAHHGTAAYDTSKQITVQATINQFDFVNPHVLISMTSKDDKGAPIKWQAELTSPNRLTRMGWSKNTLKPGDKVIATGFAAKSGANTLWIVKMSMADGTELTLNGGADN